MAPVQRDPFQAVYQNIPYGRRRPGVHGAAGVPADPGGGSGGKDHDCHIQGTDIFHPQPAGRKCRYQHGALQKRHLPGDCTGGGISAGCAGSDGRRAGDRMSGGSVCGKGLFRSLAPAGGACGTECGTSGADGYGTDVSQRKIWLYHSENSGEYQSGGNV